MGQGGNQALESVAVLANCLVELRHETSYQEPTIEDIEHTLKRYQTLRQKRAKKFVDLSGAITRAEAMATLRHTIRFLFVEPLDGEAVAGMCERGKCEECGKEEC
jgi:FAD dependent monooxygenase